jgi:hypothetical protein
MVRADQAPSLWGFLALVIYREAKEKLLEAEPRLVHPISKVSAGRRTAVPQLQR